MAKNVNRTARMQWKVDTIKNCIYLQCTKQKVAVGAVYQNKLPNNYGKFT